MEEILKYDILQVNLKKVGGSIQGGERPVIVIQNNLGNKYSPTIIVMSLTSQNKSLKQATHLPIVADEENGLSKDSILLAEQIYTVNKSDIIYKRGRIKDRNLQKKVFKCFISLAACGDDKDLELIAQ